MLQRAVGMEDPEVAAAVVPRPGRRFDREPCGGEFGAFQIAHGEAGAAHTDLAGHAEGQDGAVVGAYGDRPA